MRYLLASDLHLADESHAPASCAEGYTAELFSLLMQMREIVRQDQQIGGVVLAGDIFHLKAPTRNSHRLVQETIAALAHFTCPVAIVPGNHDMQHDRLGSIMETQPLGVIFRAGAAEPLQGWWGPHAIYGVPWLQYWAPETLGKALSDYRREVLSGAWSRTEHPLVVTHAPLYPPGQELPQEHVPASAFALAMHGRGSVFYGHVHERHGEWSAEAATTSPSGTPFSYGTVRFCNNGALSRGSLHEYNLRRAPACTVWDSQTGQFTRIDLRARPAEQAFRLAERQQVTDMAGRLDEFLASVGQTTLGVVSLESVTAHLATLDLEPGDRELALELLEAAGEAR